MALWFHAEELPYMDLNVSNVNIFAKFTSLLFAKPAAFLAINPKEIENEDFHLEVKPWSRWLFFEKPASELSLMYHGVHGYRLTFYDGLSRNEIAVSLSERECSELSTTLDAMIEKARNSEPHNFLDCGTQVIKLSSFGLQFSVQTQKYLKRR